MGLNNPPFSLLPIDFHREVTTFFLPTQDESGLVVGVFAVVAT